MSLVERLKLSQQRGYEWAMRREGSDGSGLMIQLADRCGEAARILASVDTLPKGRDAKQGSVRSKGSAVPPAAADAQRS